MTQIIDGKKIAEAICRDIAEQVKTRHRDPYLAVIIVGNDPASEIYVRRKERVATQIGITTDINRFPSDITQDALESFIWELNSNPLVDGILIQLPLPKHINRNFIVEQIDPEKDVDGFHPLNVGRFTAGDPIHTPCTPKGIMKLLDAAGAVLKGTEALVIGTGAVGRPTALLLSQAGATVTMANSQTRDLDDLCWRSGIIVAAAGCPNLVRGNHLWDEGQTTIIDVGINRLADGSIVGDVAFDECVGIVRAITPVPGGVGPMTIACLMENTLECYSRLRILKRNI
jgi:methylenetetrahydrofolate dehydrogenase (NADP+)/methenyltetrahydrofolate cyclohydrolase